VTSLAELEPDSVDVLALDGVLDGLVDPTPALAMAYRAVRHGGQLAIYAAYRRSPANLDEYSPRRWSSEIAPVYLRQDNLSGVEASPRDVLPGLDLRCWEIEFFYCPTARMLSESDRRQARQSDSSVCDAIMYHCWVVKEPLEGEALSPVWIEPATVAVRRETEQLEEIKGGLHQAYANLNEAHHRSNELDLNIQRCKAEIDLLLPLARHMAQEMDAYRSRKIIRLIERLIDRVDYAAHLSPAYRQMLDDSLIFFHPLKGYRLRPSQNLQRVPHLTYPIRLPRSGLRRLSIAAVIDLYPRAGTLGMQILGQGKVLGSATVPTRDIRADAPVVFSFYPIANDADERVELQIYARDLDVPLRIYEWHRYPFWGLGDPQVKPFCSFDFYSPGSRERG
jgi:SAM-dependent methyltransferase